MNTKIKISMRIITLMTMVVVICTSPGIAIGAANPMIPSGKSIESFTHSISTSRQVFIPLVAVPMPQTPFGAFLDAPTTDNGLSEMMSANVSWVHLPFSWKAVEPQVGQRNWAAVSGFENILRAAASKRVNAIIYLQDTPAWALKAGFVCGAVAPTKFADLGRFITDFVARYSSPPFNVKYFELWSEPDSPSIPTSWLGCWGDPSDPTYYGGGYYGEMLKTAYPAIKAAYPSAQVIFGGLLLDCDPAICHMPVNRFFEGALADGAGNFFDGIAFHAYDYYQFAPGQYYSPNWGAAWNTTGPALLSKTAYLRQALAQYHISGKYILNTELAMLCGTTGLETACVTPDHQKTVAIYLIQAYAAGIADGLRANIWYSVAGWRGSGLIDANQQPSPVYWAFANARTQIGEASFIRSITEFPGIHGYEFNHSGHRIWVLWSVTSVGNPHTVNTGSIPSAILDMYGNSLAPSTSLNVGLEPVFVVF